MTNIGGREKSVLLLMTVWIVSMVIYHSITNSQEYTEPAILPMKNKDLTIDRNQHPEYLNRNISITLFNPVPYIQLDERSLAMCSYNNCVFTNNRTDLRKRSAIIYVLTAAKKLPDMPTISPLERNPDQVWIFAYLESPVHHFFKARKVYMNKYWRNTVNWTMSYTYDADIHFPYEFLRKRNELPKRNYTEMFRNKTHMAAWIVSNCHTQSKREIYVKQLKQYGVQVDIFGACGKGRTDIESVKREISMKYKFYLAFENSFCKDYITEKLYRRLDLDAIIVARGAGDYDKIMEKGTIINARHYKNAKELARYMLSVASNETLFSQYMKKKDKYEVTPMQRLKGPACEICTKLNHLNENRRTYSDLIDRIHKNTCFKPKDLL